MEQCPNCGWFPPKEINVGDLVKSYRYGCGVVARIDKNIFTAWFYDPEHHWLTKELVAKEITAVQPADRPIKISEGSHAT